MKFTEKVVVITGGDKGFGKGLAKVFAAKGAKVVIAGPDAEQLQRAGQELGADTVLCDVTSYEQVEALKDSALERHGRIDVWINNAGIQIAPSRVEDVKVDKLRELIDVNFFGYFHGCKAVLPVMRMQGEGILVNVNSTAGLDGKPELSAYVSSKFAVKGLTLTLREELKGTGIQVFGIHPGGMQTEIYKEKYPAEFNSYMSVDYAVEKVMENFDAAQPELDLVIRRPK